MRDTPQNEASQASQDENTNKSDSFSGTEEKSGTGPEASQKGGEVDLGHNGTRLSGVRHKGGVNLIRGVRFPHATRLRYLKAIP
jgi:hypothetical protein